MSPQRNIYLPVLPGVHLLDLAAPAQIFANHRLGDRVRVRYISPCPELSSHQGLQLSALTPLPVSIGRHDWVMLIGSHGLVDQLDSPVCRLAVDWLHDFHAQFELVAGVCSGSLVAARAGLLSGRRCTTHHELLETLQALAPDALLEEDCIFVRDQQLWTSAGITTGLDSCLQLVASHWGHREAMVLAREMVLYQRRSGSEPQLSFWLRYRNHVQSRIHTAQDLVMDAPGQRWRVAELADRVHLSERHFRRLFHSATSQSIQDYLQQAKVELAARLLEQSTLSLEEIAHRCGFAAERSLRRAWSRWREESPSAYRRVHSQGIITKSGREANDLQR